MISVIICTYNRSKYLSKCLQHISKQSFDKRQYEVVLVNNNSNDETDLICKGFIEKHKDISTKYVIEYQQGLSHARNRGIAVSKGDLIAFIDDDAFAKYDFLKQLGHCFLNPVVQCIGGKVIPQYESGSPPEWMSHFLLPLVSTIDYGRKSKVLKGRYLPVGANMAFRARVFKENGVFRTDLGRNGIDNLEGGEEKDLFLRLRKNGVDIHYCPNLIVDHIIPNKRLEKTYVKGLAKGIGSSEKKRLNSTSKAQLFTKLTSEMVKLAASILLFIYYSLLLRLPAATMILRFRFWVLQGYLK